MRSTAEVPAILEQLGPSPDASARASLAPGYAYLLGVYLGDGHVARAAKGSSSLRVSCDRRYPGIVLEVKQAVLDVRGRPAGIAARANCHVVTSTWKHWPQVLPQHGAGRKHERTIALLDWQRALTQNAPRSFVRGLLHSDGCRFIARQRVGPKVHTYERYSFSNRSQDIKDLLCEHLDLLGIRWSRPNATQIAIDRRSDVAKLDAFVGPKR